MTGKGKKDIEHMKRHRNTQLKDTKTQIQGVTKPAIRRLCRRGGVKRINGLVYNQVRTVTKNFLERVLKDAVMYTEHAKRKTVSTPDVIYALKRQAINLYV